MNANLNSEELRLVETFRGMTFLNDFKIVEDDAFLKMKVELINLRAIAIFMGLVAILFPFVAYCFGAADDDLVFMCLACPVGAAGFVAVMALVHHNQKEQVLPYVDKAKQSLVLASQTSVAKNDILGFKQFALSHSNFRVVLTTVEVAAENGLPGEYAVVAVIGKFAEDRIGSELARIFDVPLHQMDARKFSKEQRATFCLE